MITKTGIWSAEEAQQSGYPKNKNLPAKLEKILNDDELVMDFGCGDAYYLLHLHSCPKKFCVIGFDGYLGENMPLSIPTVTLDLARKFHFPNWRGQVISLEVGEHIPQQYEQIFIDNLVRHCASRMVLSWAVEGQGGIGHVNCRNNDYIIEQITKRGFVHNIHLSDWLRADTPMEVRYFENTLMVFDRM